MATARRYMRSGERRGIQKSSTPTNGLSVSRSLLSVPRTRVFEPIARVRAVGPVSYPEVLISPDPNLSPEKSHVLTEDVEAGTDTCILSSEKGDSLSATQAAPSRTVRWRPTSRLASKASSLDTNEASVSDSLPLKKRRKSARTHAAPTRIHVEVIDLTADSEDDVQPPSSTSPERMVVDLTTPPHPSVSLPSPLRLPAAGPLNSSLSSTAPSSQPTPKSALSSRGQEGTRAGERARTGRSVTFLEPERTPSTVVPPVTRDDKHSSPPCAFGAVPPGLSALRSPQLSVPIKLSALLSGPVPEAPLNSTPVVSHDAFGGRGIPSNTVFPDLALPVNAVRTSVQWSNECADDLGHGPMETGRAMAGKNNGGKSTASIMDQRNLRQDAEPMNASQAWRDTEAEADEEEEDFEVRPSRQGSLHFAQETATPKAPAFASSNSPGVQHALAEQLRVGVRLEEEENKEENTGLSAPRPPQLSLPIRQSAAPTQLSALLSSPVPEAPQSLTPVLSLDAFGDRETPSNTVFPDPTLPVNAMRTPVQWPSKCADDLGHGPMETGWCQAVAGKNGSSKLAANITDQRDVRQDAERIGARQAWRAAVLEADEEGEDFEVRPSGQSSPRFAQETAGPKAPASPNSNSTGVQHTLGRYGVVDSAVHSPREKADAVRNCVQPSARAADYLKFKRLCDQQKFGISSPEFGSRGRDVPGRQVEIHVAKPIRAAKAKHPRKVRSPRAKTMAKTPGRNWERAGRPHVQKTVEKKRTVSASRQPTLPLSVGTTLPLPVGAICTGKKGREAAEQAFERLSKEVVSDENPVQPRSPVSPQLPNHELPPELEAEMARAVKDFDARQRAKRAKQQGMQQ